MAIQLITGNETGNSFINKLNNNFSQDGMHSFQIRMERGGLKSNGAIDYTLSSYNNYVRSSMFVRVNNASTVNGINFHSFSIYEYDENFSRLQTTKNEGDMFSNSCKYIKIFKNTNTVPEKCVFAFDGEVEEVYNVQIEKGTSGGHLLSETLVFEVSEGICTTARLLLPYNYTVNGEKVPMIVWCACDGSYTNWDYAIDTVGSTPNVITNQLQYLADQGFAVLNVYPWGSYNFSNFPNCGQSGAVPVPVTLVAYEKAIEYVTTRFNISDTNIFIAAWSGSGKLSAYYAIHHPSFNLRHIYAFSPVVDGGVWIMDENLGGRSGMRGAENSEMRFNGSAEQINTYLDTRLPSAEFSLTFKKLNAEKFAKCSSIQWQNLTGVYMKDGVLHNHTIEDKVEDSLNWGETWRDVTNYYEGRGFRDWTIFTDSSRQDYTPIYNRHELAITSNGAPITIIGAIDDEACPYLAMEQFIVQLQNGGTEAKIITLPEESTTDYGDGHGANLGHRAPIFYNTKSNITTKGGTTYSTVPYGWWYMVEDINSRFLK